MSHQLPLTLFTVVYTDSSPDLVVLADNWFVDDSDNFRFLDGNRTVAVVRAHHVRSFTTTSGLQAAAENPHYRHPNTAAQATNYALILQSLLMALDGEIVLAALVGEGKTDLDDSGREKVDRLRELLDSRITMGFQPTDARARVLAILDAIAGEFESAGEIHDSSPCSVCGASSVGEPPAVGDASSDPAAGEGVSA